MELMKIQTNALNAIKHVKHVLELQLIVLLVEQMQMVILSTSVATLALHPVRTKNMELYILLEINAKHVLMDV